MKQGDEEECVKDADFIQVKAWKKKEERGSSIDANQCAFRAIGARRVRDAL